MESPYFIGIILLAVPVYFLLFFLGISTKSCVIPEGEKSEKIINTLKLPWYKLLNYGAFFYTPLWLFVNGFWIFLLFDIFFLIKYWQVSLFISLYLLFFGSKLSWDYGKRWNYNSEYFLDSQSFLSFIAFINTIIIAILLVAT